MQKTIGIVGSGIAGLTAARQLTRAGVRVTVFESQSAAGIDAHAVEIPAKQGTLRADVPSRMFNRRLWPNLYRLYEETGIETAAVDTSQSFSVAGQAAWLQIRSGRNPLAHGPSWKSPAGRRLFRDLVRLRQTVTPRQLKALPPDLTLAGFLAARDFSRHLIRDFLYPTLSSTVCTCSYSALSRYPARVVLDALDRISTDRELLRARRGSREVAGKLASGCGQLRLNTRVSRITPTDDGVEVRTGPAAPPVRLDGVIMALQANQILQLLPAADRQEQSVLNSVDYEPVQVVVHNDPGFMPVLRQDWRTFNMVSAADGQSAWCSVWLNSFHQWDTVHESWFQTIQAGPASPPEVHPDRVVSRLVLQRPVMRADCGGIRQRLDAVNRQSARRIWFCGSWDSDGVPLLESGVESALRLTNWMTAPTRGPRQPAAAG